MDDLVEVELARLVVQTSDDHQYVHLRTKEDNRTFPIVIGFVEANELRRKILSQDGERPMTHDLIGRILEATDWTLKKVAVNALHDGTFFAMLVLDHDGTEKLIDCRPSDALCLAAQVGAPIFVSRSVLDEVAADQ
ncbi:MAG: bifunctional nuclease family protein [Planctomycetota bacterium]